MADNPDSIWQVRPQSWPEDFGCNPKQGIEDSVNFKAPRCKAEWASNFNITRYHAGPETKTLTLPPGVPRRNPIFLPGAVFLTSLHRCDSIFSPVPPPYPEFWITLFWSRLIESDWRGEAGFYRISLCIISKQFEKRHCIETKSEVNLANFQMSRNLSYLAILQAESPVGVNDNLHSEMVAFLFPDGMYLSSERQTNSSNWDPVLLFNPEIIEMNGTHVRLT